MKHFLFIFIVYVNLHLITQYGGKVMGSMSNFVMEKFYLCENVSVQKVLFYVNPKNSNPGLQLVDMNATTPLPVGNDMLLKMSLEVDNQLLGRHFWTHVHDVEGELCKMTERYMGELWYDIQRALGVMPRSCPFPRGNYHAVNFLFNYQKIKVQTFPYGKIKLTLVLLDKAGRETQACYICIVNNLPQK